MKSDVKGTVRYEERCQVYRDFEKVGKHLPRVKEQRNILHEISKRKANWIGHILRRNCLLQQVIEGKIKAGVEVTVEEEDVGSYWMTLRKGEDIHL
jgi:hypothetical protein